MDNAMPQDPTSFDGEVLLEIMSIKKNEVRNIL